MSIKIMTLVWQLEMPHVEKLVLLALADNASDEGSCFPSIKTLTEKCSLSERSVQGTIAKLQSAGHLTRHDRAGRSTIYQIHPRTSCTPARHAPPQRVQGTPAGAAPIPPQELHPTPAAHAPITVREPSIEPSPNRQRVTRARVSRDHSDPQWLLDFKLAYPERAGDPKWRSAVKAANARLDEGHSTHEFIDGAKRYAVFCEATGKVGTEYVKQASTFLGPDKPFLLPWKPPDITPVVNLSPGEIVARAYEAQRNGNRVVAEQTGSNGGGMEEPLRRLWPTLPA